MLSKLFEQFIHQQSHKYSPPTMAAYGQALLLFKQHLRDQHALNISPTLSLPLRVEWGETFLSHLQETRSVETEHLYMRAIIQFFQFAAEHDATLDIEGLTGYVEANRRPKTHHIPTLPFDAINRIIDLAIASTGQINATTVREELGLLRDRAFILTLAFSGLRISEICYLPKSAIDFGAEQLASEENNPLPLPTTAIRALNAYLNKRGTWDQYQPASVQKQLPLFARHDKRVGSRILPISRWTGANIVEGWVRMALSPEEQHQLAQAKQVITPHTFRHHFVINALLNTDYDIAAAQSMARHEDKSTTRRYLAKLTHDSESHS